MNEIEATQTTRITPTNKPYVSAVSSTQIVISGLPPLAGYTDQQILTMLNQSRIIDVIHDHKHLWRDGNRRAVRGENKRPQLQHHRRDKSGKLNAENQDVILSFAYVPTLVPEPNSSGNYRLIINFYLSTTHGAPYKVHYYDDNPAGTEHRSAQAPQYEVFENAQTLRLAPMNAREIEHHCQRMTQQVADELTQLLDDISLTPGVQPLDYYRPAQAV